MRYKCRWDKATQSVAECREGASAVDLAKTLSEWKVADQLGLLADIDERMNSEPHLVQDDEMLDFMVADLEAGQQGNQAFAGTEISDPYEDGRWRSMKLLFRLAL